MVRIKSLTDVVTNSSSETFIIKNPRVSKEELIKILQDYHETHLTENWDRSDNFDDIFSSGMGGFRINTFQDEYLEAKKYYPKTKQHLFTPKYMLFPNSSQRVYSKINFSQIQTRILLQHVNISLIILKFQNMMGEVIIQYMMRKEKKKSSKL